MSVLGTIPKKKNVIKLKKNKHQLIKKHKVSESNKTKGSNLITPVVPASDNINKNLETKNSKDVSHKVIAKNLVIDSDIPTKKKKGNKKKQLKIETEDSNENSVFAVTEKFLQKKKEQKEKKLQKSLKKKEADKKNNVSNQEVQIKEFFEELNKDVKGKAKPRWFDIKLKGVLATYLQMVELCNKEPNIENKLMRSGNEKRLFRFFLNLSKHLGEEIHVIRHWFHTTKNGVLKSGLSKKQGDSSVNVVKFAHLKKKLNAIIKETAGDSCNTSVKSKETPVWFNEKFAELVRIRNKARRQFKLRPTNENKEAYQVAIKKLKSERKTSKKNTFVSSEPYLNDDKKFKDGGKVFTKNSRPVKLFESSNPIEKSRNFSTPNAKDPKKIAKSSAESPRNFTANARSPQSFTPSRMKHSQGFTLKSKTPNKHIKFDD